MKMISLIKIINRYSIIFAIANYVMAGLGYENQNGFLFVWLCFISYIIYLVREKQSTKTIALISLACLFPLAAGRSIDQVLVTLVLSAYSVCFAVKGMKDEGYESAIAETRKSLIIVAVLIALSLISFSSSVLERVSWYYIVIFAVSAIVYLRMKRSIEFSGNDKKNRRISSYISVSICIFAAIISIRTVRDALLKSVSMLYLKAVDLLMFLLSWLISLIGHLILWIVNLLKGDSSRQADKYEQMLKSMNNSGYKNLPQKQNVDTQSIFDILSKNPYVVAAFKIVFLALILYIVYKVFKNKASGANESEAFVESREYIRDTNNKKSGGNKVLGLLRPRNSTEYIRYCYKNFMLKSVNAGITILKSDTTSEINEKAKYSFNRESLENIRKFYITARYTNTSVDKTSLKLFNKYYRDLNK